MVKSDDTDNLTDEWISDSGASKPITGRKDWMIIYHTSKVATYVSLTDNHQAKVVGTGTVLLEAFMQGQWHRCTIDNVLYIPGAINLFSESVMAMATP